MLRRVHRAVVLGSVVVGLAACGPAPINDHDADKAVGKLPGVVRAAANCTHPLEGYDCTLDVHVTHAASARQIIRIVRAAAPTLTAGVTGVRILDGKNVLTVLGGDIDGSAVGAEELVRMRGLAQVTQSTIDLRSANDRSVTATVGNLDAGLGVAKALRTDQLTNVTVLAPALQLTTAAGLPTREFALAQRGSHIFKGVSLYRVDSGHVVFYCQDEDARKAVLARAPSLPGYGDVAKVDAFLDAPEPTSTSTD